MEPQSDARISIGSITLSPDQSRTIEALIASGQYASASDVVRAGLDCRLWMMSLPATLSVVLSI
jgi:hypothetical protein